MDQRYSISKEIAEIFRGKHAESKVKGYVDESLRALMEVSVGAKKDAEKAPLTVWIDTAFNGGLVIPHSHIGSFGLKKSSTTQAVLADGQAVDLETFTCYLEWFGNVYRTQAVASDAEFPLLGTMLLVNRQLAIDYKSKTVALD